MAYTTSGQITDKPLIEQFQELVELAKSQAFAHTPNARLPFMERRTMPLHHVKVKEGTAKADFYVASLGHGKNAFLVLASDEAHSQLLKTDTGILNCLRFKESRGHIDYSNWSSDNQKPEEYIAQLYAALKPL